MPSLRHLLGIACLVGAFLGAQVVAQIHGQSHALTADHSHDWISEHLGEHACATIDQLASATPSVSPITVSALHHRGPALGSASISWCAVNGKAWFTVRAPPSSTQHHLPAFSSRPHAAGSYPITS